VTLEAIGELNIVIDPATVELGKETEITVTDSKGIPNPLSIDTL
jgi:hypothetical protein